MATEEEQIIDADVVEVKDSALMAADKAAIDMQVATAKAYPRSVAQFKKTLTELATLDRETAASLTYRLPRGGKEIVGPSVRFAELVQYSWGNCRADARVIDIDDKHLTAQGTCFDCERNIATRVEVKTRITYSNGKRYNDDMITVAGNAACSKAFRNAVFKCIPFTLAKQVWEKAQQMVISGAESIDEKRKAEITAWRALGADLQQLYDYFEVKGYDDFTLDHLLRLSQIRTAVNDGDLSLKNLFDRETEKPGSGLAEKLAAAKEKKATREAKSAKKSEEKSEETPVVPEGVVAHEGNVPLELEESQLEAEGA